jgi:hypothetical protein
MVLEDSVQEDSDLEGFAQEDFAQEDSDPEDSVSVDISDKGPEVDKSGKLDKVSELDTSDTQDKGAELALAPESDKVSVVVVQDKALAAVSDLDSDRGFDLALASEAFDPDSSCFHCRHKDTLHYFL